MRLLSSVLILGLALWTIGCGDDHDDHDDHDNGAEDTITLNGSCSDWLRTEPFPFAGANVCVHDADPANCAEIDAAGNFALSGLAKESAINLTVEGGGIFPSIYPIGTGSEDVTWSFTLVAEAAATLVIDGFPGVESVDDTKGHMALYAAAGDLNRGVLGAVFASAPETAYGFKYFDNFGLSLDAEATTFSGNAVSPNIEPGDYTVTATAPGTTCVSSYDARENAEGGLVVPVVAGYTSFGFVACSAGAELSAGMTITELNPAAEDAAAIEGAEVCVYASAATDAEPLSPCAMTDAEGAVSFTGPVAYSRVVTEIKKEGYVTSRVQGEMNGSEFTGAGFLAAEGIVGAVLGLSGVTEGIDAEAGHILLNTLNADGPVAGSTFTLTGEGGEVTMLYFDGTRFAAEGATTVEGTGAAGAFNIAPGTYTWTVSSGAKTCRNQGGTWGTTTGASNTSYQIDVVAGAITGQWINCK